jgi:hypothetical protein
MPKQKYWVIHYLDSSSGQVKVSIDVVTKHPIIVQTDWFKTNTESYGKVLVNYQEIKEDELTEEVLAAIEQIASAPICAGADV